MAALGAVLKLSIELYLTIEDSLCFKEEVWISNAYMLRRFDICTHVMIVQPLFARSM